MPLPRKEVAKIEPYVHGKSMRELQRELRISEIIKLGSNENPLGMSPRARDAYLECIDECHFYPEAASYDLVDKLSKRTGFSKDQIIIGAGATELVEMLSLAYFNPGEEVITSKVTFIMYKIVATLMGIKTIQVPLKKYRYDLEAMASRINRKTKLAFIANPNNPTGTIVTKKELDKFIRRAGKRIITVVDEAYFDFVENKDYPNAFDYVRAGKNVISLRTFSKNYGLAGLRVAYAVGPQSIIKHLYKVKKPFNVSHLAQAAAIAALDDTEHLRRSRELVFDEKKYLYKEYTRLGLKYIPTEANFIVLNMSTAEKAKAISKKLLRKGIITRPMDGAWGAPHLIRISIGTHDQNVALIKALESIL
jgi:histidinol-phosphate aminotransferase